MNTYHVATDGDDTASGASTDPLRTIDRAAQLARPGDEVIVHEGEYREWVRPLRGGRSNTRRITYAAAAGERVVIKGSERVRGWEHQGGDVWRAEVPTGLFGSFNPFAEEVAGDWIVYASPYEPRKHLGQVYLNGTGFTEVPGLDQVYRPPSAPESVDHWTGVQVPDRSTGHVWHAQVGEHATTIWANFQGADPNTELVEINVRPAVFHPQEPHRDYITVRGFEMAHAASPWAPPTADQPGLIGPGWAKGWIIEDNLIHHAKCVGLSLGKNGIGGHNFAADRQDKPGYQYQLEAVFTARRQGWSKEEIGSHVVRRNTIRDCGQAGIVGHLGCVFSTIEDNHIHRVGIAREFYGYEIAGIKLHAAIDVTIRANRIHDCSLGTWLDWQAQGTRVQANTFYHNNRDLFVEVSNGPYLVDHNILASPAAIENFSQGGAYVHNLIAGTVVLEPVVDRPTPYHLPHSTEVAGYAAIRGGDDRWIANLFTTPAGESGAYGRAPSSIAHRSHGTSGYDAHPGNMTDYLAQVGDPSHGDHERFFAVPAPVYLHHNAYGPGTAGYAGEEDATVLSDARARVEERDGAGYLVYELGQEFEAAHSGAIDGSDLERVRLVDADFEDPEGLPVRFDTDLLGQPKALGERYPAGPLAALRAGAGEVRIW